MSKKLLSVVLALALAISCFAVVGFAVGGLGYEDDKSALNYTQTWALGEPVPNADGTYSVDVKLTAAAAEGYEYLVGPIQFKVNKTVSGAGTVELTDVKLSTAVTNVWGPQNVGCYANYEDETGIVLIIPTPAAGTDAVSGLDLSAGAVIATLEYTSEGGAATLAIDVKDVKTNENRGGSLFAARMSDGNVVTGTSIVGQTVTPTTNTVTIGSNASTPPELVVVDGTIGIIDTSKTMLDETDIDGDGDYQDVVDGYLLGFDPDNNSSIDEIFEVVGDGKMVVIPTSSGAETGTGAIVQVVDNNDKVVAQYVLIVFGDVNGDGFADDSDSSVILDHAFWILGDYMRLYSYQEFAGDANGDGFCDDSDESVVLDHAFWMLGEKMRLDIPELLAKLGY